MARNFKKLAKLRRDPSRFVIDMLAKRKGIDPVRLNKQFEGAGRFTDLIYEGGQPVTAARLTVDGERSEGALNLAARSISNRNRPVRLVAHDIIGPGRRMPARLTRAMRDGVNGSFNEREAELIEFEYGPHASIWSMHQQRGDLENSNLLPHVWPFARSNGFLLSYNPSSCLPFLLSLGWPAIRHITVLDRPVPTSDPLHQLLPEADVVLAYPQAHGVVSEHRYLIELTDEAQLDRTLLAVLQTLRQGSPDPFIPIVYETSEKVIDPLESNLDSYDAVARLRKEPDVLSHLCFDTFLDEFVSNLDVFLLRGNLANRYTSFVEGKQASHVVKASLRDGARVLFL